MLRVVAMSASAPLDGIAYSNRNPLRTAGQNTQTVETHDFPEHVDLNDWEEIKGGGYKSKPGTTATKGDTNFRIFYTFNGADPFVLVDYFYYYDNILISKGGQGDGVTPFPNNPGETFGGTSFNMNTQYPGNWRAVFKLTHQSGYINYVTHDYTVPGDGSTAFTDEELYIGGIPIPEYSEDWQRIADQWDEFGNPLKRDASLLRVASEPNKPTPATHPYSFPLSSVDASAPADVQQAKAIAEEGQTAPSAAVDSFEALAQTDYSAAVAAEDAAYADIVQSWKDLSAATSNPNLKQVADAVAETTQNLRELVALAHNGQESFAYADEGWEKYQRYAAWFEKQSADTVVSMQVWDEVLGQPN